MKNELDSCGEPMQQPMLNKMNDLVTKVAESWLLLLSAAAAFGSL